MRRVLLVLLAVLLLPGVAQARISPGEARWAAGRAGEAGPWTETQRLGTNLYFLRARSSETREYDAACPDGFGCSPECHWTETTENDLQVWVRKLGKGRYRVRDNLGWVLTVRR